MRTRVTWHAGPKPAQIWQTIPALVVSLNPVVVLSFEFSRYRIYQLIRLTNLMARRGTNTQVGMMLEFVISKEKSRRGCALAKPKHTRPTPKGFDFNETYFIHLQTLEGSPRLIFSSIEEMETLGVTIGLIVINDEPRLAVCNHGDWKVLKLHGTIR